MRTLIKTTSAGWFIDADDLDGKRVRKGEGDNVITREEFEAAKAAPAAAAPKADKPEVQVKTLTSGKVAIGKTATIRCAWVDADKRTPAQQKLFDELPPAPKMYELMVKAAGGKAEAMPSGEEREIKVQDLFQVRFSTANAEKWRNELRRRSNAKKRAEREAALAAKAS
jgi:hypothetical protein